jgi:hypothetical protein
MDTPETLELRKNLVKAWLEALESGRYKQGKGQLRTDLNEFCCLGVLCDVAVEHFELGKWNDSNQEVYKLNGKESCFDLHPTLAVMAGLDYEKQSFYTHANDSLDMNFKQIAGVIRQDFLNVIKGIDQ